MKRIHVTWMAAILATMIAVAGCGESKPVPSGKAASPQAPSGPGKPAAKGGAVAGSPASSAPQVEIALPAKAEPAPGIKEAGPATKEAAPTAKTQPMTPAAEKTESPAAEKPAAPGKGDSAKVLGAVGKSFLKALGAGSEDASRPNAPPFRARPQ